MSNISSQMLVLAPWANEAPRLARGVLVRGVGKGLCLGLLWHGGDDQARGPGTPRKLTLRAGPNGDQRAITQGEKQAG